MTHKIIEPGDPDVIEQELKSQLRLRLTNKGGNEIYIFDGANAPTAMREVGRLREIAFRTAGGGTGKECDIDSYDIMNPPCHQLVVWDPDQRLILGGYRYLTGPEIEMLPSGKPRMAISHMFDFSREFLRDYLPITIELGRSFVRLEYQSTRAGFKAIYALDNLWDGLGALTVLHPEMKYLLGKVTMYPSYTRECRDMILFFLHKHFPDSEGLCTPINPLEPEYDHEAMEQLFGGSCFREDYRILKRAVARHGQAIPPLVNAYMSLSPTMKMFGTAINDEFGDVEESGIFFKIDEIFEEKKQRHIPKTLAAMKFLRNFFARYWSQTRR